MVVPSFLPHSLENLFSWRMHFALKQWLKNQFLMVCKTDMINETIYFQGALQPKHHHNIEVWVAGEFLMQKVGLFLRWVLMLKSLGTIALKQIFQKLPSSVMWHGVVFCRCTCLHDNFTFMTLSPTKIGKKKTTASESNCTSPTTLSQRSEVITHGGMYWWIGADHNIFRTPRRRYASISYIDTYVCC